MFDDYYRGKRIVVTGHTGFKGSWLSFWLKKLEALVFGIGLEAPTVPSFYEVVRHQVFDGETECDIQEFEPFKACLDRYRPELIFHLAAQPLVRQSFEKPLETFSVNALGTVHLLEAARQLELSCPLVLITTDKCYANQGWLFGYRENDPLGGDDIYSMSKAAAELAIHAWRQSFFSRNAKLGNIASARGGNVIGGGDYARDRILPDCVRSLSDQSVIQIRNPAATRPWQHVFDCLSGYLWLGARLGRSEKNSPLASAFNFGPALSAHRSVHDLVSEFLKHWPGRCESARPEHAPPEAPKLNLSIDKAAALLQWLPTWDFAEAVAETAAWYRQRHVEKSAELLRFSSQQLDAFTAAAAVKGAVWSR